MKTRLIATVLLTALILAVLAGAFAASLPALLAAAHAIHLTGVSAWGYAIVPDSAVVVSLVALLLLRNDKKAVALSLGTLGTFTLASLTLNEAHALGLFEQRHPALILVAGAVPVVAVLLASHQLMHCFRVLFPAVEAPRLPQPKRTPTKVDENEKPKAKKVDDNVTELRKRSLPELTEAARELKWKAEAQGQELTVSRLMKDLRVSHKRAKAVAEAIAA
ncbi:hypothetical protein [Nocardiopsis halotolerans]|uniref:hypothetical protein n=1 Tax=Nocardiopsis halotolerans TaxID=124252 RepID=UPI000364DCD4|nr:hypothetical protein [Nocardiopsis halotolerans]